MSDESGCVGGGALAQFGPSAVQFLTESADPNVKIFPWSMPARYYQKPGRMVIYGTCLVAGTTRKGDTFSKEELERHGCTLIHGPIEAFVHSWDDGGNHWLSYPENVILDAEEVDGELQYIAGIEDQEIQKAISNKEITGVSVNTICRRVPADDPGVCHGMILNGFCLLSKDSVPASPGTNVRVWNSIPVLPLRLETGKPCSKTEKVGEKTSEETETPGQKTEQEVIGTGPSAGVVEPSIEDRVKTLEQRFEGFNQFVSEQFTAINAKLDTLIAVKTSSAAPASTPATAATPGQKTEAEWDTEYINDLPDEHFAFIDEGGEKDDQGKTVPRDLRHLPFKNAQGVIDYEHLVNALARVKQAETMPEGGKQAAIKKLCAAVGEWNQEHKDQQIESEVCNIEPSQKTQQASSGPAAATVPIDKLPPPEINVKVEEIVAIVQNRALFTPALKLNAILDLCAQRRAEVA